MPAGGFLCGPSSLHPYECGADCPHCARADTEQHDPRSCELCDPEYDGMPNKFRRRRKTSGAKAARTFWPGFRWRILAHERTGQGRKPDYTGRQLDLRAGKGPLAMADAPTPIQYIDGDGQHWEFDELAIDHWFHLEQMGDRDWWIGIGDPSNGDYYHVNVHIDRDGKTTVSVEDQT